MKTPTIKPFVASVLIVLICILLPQSVFALGAVQNPGFENESNWTYFDNGEYWTGEYNGSWASEGSRSYKLHIPPSIDFCYNAPGENTYAEIYQDVDLTGISEVFFDIATSGMWDVTGLGTQYYTSAEVWIGDTLVYIRERDTGTFLAQSFLTEGYYGVYRLSFRMQSHGNFCTTGTRELYIDNIRPVYFDIDHRSYLPAIIR
jgi:hypothetical protein